MKTINVNFYEMRKAYNVAAVNRFKIAKLIHYIINTGKNFQNMGSNFLKCLHFQERAAVWTFFF